LGVICVGGVEAASCNILHFSTKDLLKRQKKLLLHKVKMVHTGKCISKYHVGGKNVNI
jgi:hypothetical protein